MTNLLNIFTPSSTNIFFVSGVAGIAGLTLGFIIKSASIARHKKRVISLEDEMLLNHSRILDLEKQVAQLKEENAKLNTNAPLQKMELKAS